MSLCEFWIEFQRLLRCQYRSGTLLFGHSAHKNCSQARVSFRQPQVTGRVCRILAYRLFEIGNALLYIGLIIALGESELALEIIFVDFWRDGTHSREPPVFLPRDRDLN